jgi:hypothetical protein
MAPQTAVQSKQRFRVELCRSVVAKVKPFYQAKRFNSYVSVFVISLLLHLYSLVLSASCVGRLPAFGEETHHALVQDHQNLEVERFSKVDAGWRH